MDYLQKCTYLFFLEKLGLSNMFNAAFGKMDPCLRFFLTKVGLIAKDFCGSRTEGLKKENAQGFLAKVEPIAKDFCESRTEGSLFEKNTHTHIGAAYIPVYIIQIPFKSMYCRSFIGQFNVKMILLDSQQGTHCFATIKCDPRGVKRFFNFDSICFHADTSPLYSNCKMHCMMQYSHLKYFKHKANINGAIQNMLVLT